MIRVEPAEVGDLSVVASWLRSARECELWSGSRVGFPVDVPKLPEALEWASSRSWVAVSATTHAGFGQVVSKAAGRLHLARLITNPTLRGQGVGRTLAERLLSEARRESPPVVSLNVAAGNTPAVALYQSLGFVEAARPVDEPRSESVYMVHAV